MELRGQAGRLALEHMQDAGYDPREASTIFSSLSKKSQGGKELHIGERRYYELIASETRKQLEDAYPNVTVSGLKVGAEEYRELLADLHAARSKPTK